MQDLRKGRDGKKQRRGKRAAGDLTVNIWPDIYTDTQTQKKKTENKEH